MQAPRKTLKTIGLSKKNAPSRKKIDAKWRDQTQPTLPQVKVVVQRMISNQKEMKYFDTTASTTSNGTTGNVFSLTDIPQSTGNSTDITRIGDSVQIKNIEYRFAWNAADTFQFGRLIMFRWKPSYGSTSPSPTNILMNIGTPNGNVYSPLVHDQRGQFEVLLDITSRGMTGVYDVPSQMVKGRWIAPKVGKNPQWSSGSTTNVQNGIYVLHISDSLAITHPGFNYYFRVNFQDA